MAIEAHILEYFSAYISKRLGIEYKPENYYQLEGRLNEIVRQGPFDSVQDLYSAALGNRLGNLETLLLDVATNNETSFFRDPNVWAVLTEKLLGNVEFLASRGNRLKIWCAAASTGQEPYTLAMILKETQLKVPSLKFEIIATDISERVLEVARNGVYTQLQVQRGLSMKQLVRWFSQLPQTDALTSWKIAPDLANCVSFQKMNLLDEWNTIGPCDLIFCRNVLIYQGMANKQTIISRLHEKLSEGGYLILGGTESLLGLKSAFQLEATSGLLLYRKSEQLKATG